MMAGQRLRETLILNGGGDFGEDPQVVIAGLTSTYSQYVATYEEYSQQQYEAASTLYGPHTLSAYIQEFKKLAKAMLTGESLPLGGPSPPNLYDVQIGLSPSPLGDFPPLGLNFSDMEEDITLPESRAFKIGERVNPTFWSANPRYDLLREAMLAIVEKLEGEQWIPAYDDDDFCLYFKRYSGLKGFYGSATIAWGVPQEVKPGIYRLRHYGPYKTMILSPIDCFTGASSAFKVS